MCPVSLAPGGPSCIWLVSCVLEGLRVSCGVFPCDQRLVSLNRITDSLSEANPATDMLTGATTQGLKCDLLGRFHGKVWISVFMGKIRSSGRIKPVFHPSTEKSLVPSLHFSWSYGQFGPGEPPPLPEAPLSQFLRRAPKPPPWLGWGLALRRGEGAAVPVSFGSHRDLGLEGCGRSESSLLGSWKESL